MMGKKTRPREANQVSNLNGERLKKTIAATLLCLSMTIVSVGHMVAASEINADQADSMTTAQVGQGWGQGAMSIRMVEAAGPQTRAPATGPLYVDPQNPRYFTDGSGRAILLSGAHTWYTLQDSGRADPPAAFDYAAFLDSLQAHNNNFFRMFVWEQAKWSVLVTGDYYYNPLPYQRTGPGTALDGKPKFDLTSFNQAYFDRLRQRVMQAGQRGIYVSIQLFEGFSVESKPFMAANNPWPGHPFNSSNNINAINGDPNGDGQGPEVHTLQVPAVTALQEAYVRKVIDTVNDLDNVLFEISNESNGNSQDWQYHMIDYIKNYEATKPKQHPVGMTVEWPGGNNAELFASNADWISPNSEGGYFTNPPASDGSKVIVNDTDHLMYPDGDRQWMWMSFMRGLNPAFMDPYDCTADPSPPGCNPNNPTWVSLRLNLGYAQTFANRMNLEAMIPRADLCSTQYCLANAVATGAEYLVYLPPFSGSITMNLTATPGNLSVEWFNPSNGTSIASGTVVGGATRSFTAPFSGDAVLYLYAPSGCYDFNGNGVVDTNDIAVVAVRWTLTAANPDPDGDPNTPNYESRYDVNSDSVINITDIQKVASHWNIAC